MISTSTYWAILTPCSEYTCILPSQETKVGDGYQATIPDYAPCTPFPSTATKARDLLMWSPRGTTEDKGEGDRTLPWQLAKEKTRGHLFLRPQYIMTSLQRPPL